MDVNPGLIAGAFDGLIGAMTLDEKIQLVSGRHMWKTAAIERLDIPSIVMTDGTYGVRYSVDQIDGDQPGGQDFAAFLSVVNQKANGVEIAFGTINSATCFPNGSSVACSWDLELLREMGDALGLECQEYGVGLLLGPGINIRRTPLGGRSYEYYSEDPMLTGDLAAALINGLQGQGVGASLKHFAANNSEIERTSMDSLVEERALREIYLRSFERAIAQSRPWTVMTSYNVLNGVQASESPWLLSTVLRDDWGYDGLVVSDWHGIKDRAASLTAGNDLDMPESGKRKQDLRAAIDAGDVSVDVLDTSCRRVLELVRQALAGARKGVTFDRAKHHALARKIAGESIVLLKNDGILPIDPQASLKVVVIGAGAEEPVIQGSGCATTTPTQVDAPLAEIRKLAGSNLVFSCHQGFSDDLSLAADLAEEAVHAARSADLVLIFGSTEVGYDGEGSDRRNLSLAPGQDGLIAEIAQINSRTVVVLSNPDAITMPWLDDVAAVVETFFSGQGMGGGVADVLFGVVNPSGKLTVTFPKKLGDVPGFLSYPGENRRHVYSEGIFVGYRGYDARDTEPLFPFGFGLSYTQFAYSDVTLDKAELRPGETVAVSFTVTNTGTRAGKEIAQVYVERHDARHVTPPRELKGFAKVALQPGESKIVTVSIPVDDLRVYDAGLGRWVLDNGALTLHVGASSRDLKLAATATCVASEGRYRPIQRDTQPIFMLNNPPARRVFREFLQARLAIAEGEAEDMLEHCANSFIGLFTTFERRFRIQFTEADIAQVLADIDRAVAEDAKSNA
ncbi:beta-glucosidase [Devosia sp. YR412]|uniref:beta-glucosidase n=1 Tax=Devosia sp. YR412 TaxID=1881030 RepID=UPI0008CCC63C|nr:glycoside hydrolase family 3 C-terminal domain-containing protein [Devosia sp. YR412]SEQ54054.1 beta-glucosidase [Devosia sp. YR412]